MRNFSPQTKVTGGYLAMIAVRNSKALGRFVVTAIVPAAIAGAANSA